MYPVAAYRSDSGTAKHLLIWRLGQNVRWHGLVRQTTIYLLPSFRSPGSSMYKVTIINVNTYRVGNG